jgi:hypothetical protein
MCAISGPKTTNSRNTYVFSHLYIMNSGQIFLVFSAMFLKLSAIVDHFIGGRRTRGPPSSNSPPPKVNVSEHETYYAFD